MRFSRTHHWGFWGTAGLGALNLAVSALIQVLVFFVFAEAILGEQPGVTVEELATNGHLMAVATCRFSGLPWSLRPLCSRSFCFAVSCSAAG